VAITDPLFDPLLADDPPPDPPTERADTGLGR